ncbi:hypothetical protein [Singulisphaera sp. PoT]|uniref:hypothetical protein n=1 Tax=Singulisphaera sp. PoT TaxID=3411797 RepID=UPI003BF488C6
MRAKRPRLTLARMMCGIAIMAFAIHLGTLCKRSMEYRRMARHYASLERISSQRAKVIETGLFAPNGYDAEEQSKIVETSKKQAVHLARIKSRYQRAMLFPWVRIEPELPLSN